MSLFIIIIIVIILLHVVARRAHTPPPCLVVFPAGGGGADTRPQQKTSALRLRKSLRPLQFPLAAGAPIIPAKRISFSVRAPFQSGGPQRRRDRLDCGVLGGGWDNAKVDADGAGMAPRLMARDFIESSRL